jgi:hypothetical protein
MSIRTCMERIAPLLKRLLIFLVVLMNVFILVIMAGGVIVLTALGVKGELGVFGSVLMFGSAAFMAWGLKTLAWDFIDANLPRWRRFFQFLQ